MSIKADVTELEAIRSEIKALNEKKKKLKEKEKAVEFMPDTNSVKLTSGKVLNYDYMVVFVNYLHVLSIKRLPRDYMFIPPSI